MSFNPSITHYRREHAPRRLYLPAEINAVEMYNEYLLECAEKNCKSYSHTLHTNAIREKKYQFCKIGGGEM